MSKLDEFYALRDSLLTGNELNDENWKAVEQSLIGQEIVPEIVEALRTILTKVKSPLSVHIDYEPNDRLSVSVTPYLLSKKIVTTLSQKEDKSHSIRQDAPQTEMVNEQTESLPTEEAPTEKGANESAPTDRAQTGSASTENVPTEETPAEKTSGGSGTSDTQRRRKVDFSVRLNGQEVQGKNAAMVMVNTIQQIGFERVAELNFLFGNGQYNLVDTKKRTDGDHKWQHQVGKWYVYVNSSTPTKVRMLREIAKKLNLVLVVTENN